jgi:hypothetical protein
MYKRNPNAPAEENVEAPQDNKYVKIIEIVGLTFLIFVVMAILCFIYSLWRKFRQET